MAEELSGEHKLRIVLESILRNIPKEEQCKKYGISEDVFQEWHDHLITNGGKIFDPDFGKTRTRVRKVHRMSSLSKALLTFSLLANFAVLIFLAVWRLYPFDEAADSDLGVGGDQSISRVSPSDVALVEEESGGTGEANLVTEEEASDPSKDRLVPTEPLPPPRSDLEHLLAKPVVYLLDVGTHVLAEKETKESFKAMKTEILSSIANLSPRSYFNLVLFWNLREAHALGKTILRANQENKKYAIDWLSSLGETTDELKVKRSQYYPKELLYAKPLPGVVGLWYGLSTAISFDPDLVFVAAGNLPAFNLTEIPKSHFEGLGIDPGRLSHNPVWKWESTGFLKPIFSSLFPLMRLFRAVWPIPPANFRKARKAVSLSIQAFRERCHLETSRGSVLAVAVTLISFLLVQRVFDLNELHFF